MTAAFALALAVSWWNGRIGRRHLHRQETYLDHQQATNDRAIAQTEETNRLIAERYARSDEIERQIVARTEESLRLHGEAVAQLAELNATISRIARRLDSLEPPRSA